MKKRRHARQRGTAAVAFHFTLALFLVSAYGFPSSSYPGLPSEAASGFVQRALVAERNDPVMSPRLRAMISQSKADESVVVWVFFTDKGVFSEDAYEHALKKARAALSHRTRQRRAKLGGESLVDFKDLAVNPDYVRQAVGLGAILRTTSKWFNGISVEIETDRLKDMAKLPFVRSIEPVARSKRTPVPESEKSTGPHDAPPRAARVGRLNYGPSFDQLQQINVPAVHDLGYSGEGVIVCILDTGFDVRHESFQRLHLLAEWDFIFNDGNTANEEEDRLDQHNHGTEVLSVIGGAMDGQLYGPAYGASFLLAKTEDMRSETPIEEDYWVAGIEWADEQGADITTSSLGYVWSDCPYDEGYFDGDTYVTTRAADIAASKGIVVCNAMGNEGHWIGSIVAPADADSIVACGAVTSNGTLAGLSSIGPTSDGRTKPEVLARGVGTHAATPDPYHTDGYGSKSGTSYSTPLVAGCAALLLQAHPDWTPMQVREALMMTASRADEPDNLYGWGIVDCLEALNYVSTPVSPPESQPPLPVRFHLAQNYPNPFNPGTSIQYSVISDQSPPYVTLKIYNILGHEVRTVVDDVQEAGHYVVAWDGRDDGGHELPTGVYFYRMKASGIFPDGGGHFTATRSMVLLK